MIALHPTLAVPVALGLVALCGISPGPWRGPLFTAAGCLAWALLRRPAVRPLLVTSAMVVMAFGWIAVFLAAGATLLPLLVPNLQESLLRTASLGLRSVGALWAIQGARGGSDAGDLLGALRQLGVPAVVVSLLFIAYRHFFTYAQRAGEIHRALVARSSGRRTGPMVLASVCGTLLAQAHDRADRLALALVARGFTGALPTRAMSVPPAWQAVAAAVFLAALAGIVWAGH
jgi:cobalt/nickel transport system permease protein